MKLFIQPEKLSAGSSATTSRCSACPRRRVSAAAADVPLEVLGAAAEVGQRRRVRQGAGHLIHNLEQQEQFSWIGLLAFEFEDVDNVMHTSPFCLTDINRLGIHVPCTRELSFYPGMKFRSVEFFSGYVGNIPNNKATKSSFSLNY
jgi:hypothetical protein